MNKGRLIVTACMGILGLLTTLSWPMSSPGQAPTSPVGGSSASPGCHPYGVNTLLTPDLLIPGMLPPCAPFVSDKEGPFSDPVDKLQHGFDLYSWLTFVALNSPADTVTPIGKGRGLAGDAPTIWETYKQLPDVMLETGQKPTPWGQPAVIPEVCRSIAGQGRMVIHIGEETFNQPFKTGPLIDQSGNYALFIILMNKQMFDYVVDNELYSKGGQEKFAGPVDFPKGTNGNPKMNTPPAVGAIMLKASWKVMGSGDALDKFHTLDALVYTPKSTNPKIDATCVAQKLGLVGFHVGHKTEFAPQWVWTTFEHINNVPDHADATAHRNLFSRYNFYDPGCDRTRCLPNQPPPRPWDPREQPFRDAYRSQITRIIPITNDVVKINFASQSIAGIKGTVWENYMLVSTQWPTDFQNKIDPTGVPAPPFLANTTLETYSQGEIPVASSSCIACHNNATSQHKDARSSDFTFILEKAH
jgi:hypothetical protein